MITVDVTQRLYAGHVHYGSDQGYAQLLAEILDEIVQVCGSEISGGEYPLRGNYPVFAHGCLWAFKFGQPQDHQTHYIEFLREEHAMFYVLKYGGRIIEHVKDVELGYARV